jgi:hypothetical protein
MPPPGSSPQSWASVLPAMSSSVPSYRVREKGKRTKFADLLWRPRLLLEMKARGEKLQHHYRQAFDY